MKVQIKAQTRRKGLIDVNELNAYQVAYGKPLDYKDYFQYIGLPAVAMAGLAFALWYNIWVSIICALIGAVYGLKSIMPKSIKRKYNMKSLQARKIFINNMTQILTDDSKTLNKALSIAKERTKGELKEDINLLETKIHGANKFQISEAFSELKDKYEHDVVFTQYLEQLETAIFEGRNNIDTLQQIKSYHNDMVTKTNEYMRLKDGHVRDMKQLSLFVALFILAITFSFGFQTFYDGFAKSIVGWVIGGAYYVLMARHCLKFFSYYFDDEIMSLGVSK